jgi:hypothetical protein
MTQCASSVTTKRITFKYVMASEPYRYTCYLKQVIASLPYINPNPHTVPLIPNRYGKRGACAGLSPSPTPSTRRPSVSRPRVGGGGGGGPGGGGGGERCKRASYPVNRAYTHKIYNFLIPY